MSDLISIYVVALMFYLVESVRRTGLQGVAFEPNWRGSRYRVKFPAIYPGNGDWGWLILNLLRPWNPMFVVDPPEIRFSPAGLLYGRLDDASRLHSSDWPVKIELEEGALKLDGCEITCASERLWRDALIRIHGEEAEIQRFFADSFDTAAAANRLSDFRTSTKPLRWLTASLLAIVVIVFPILAVILPPSKAVIAFGALLFAHSVWIAIRFHRAHLHLYHHGKRAATWKMALYPIAALRAIDELARDLWACYQPVAVAAVLSSAQGQIQVAERALRDAEFPVNANAEDPLGVAVLDWHSRQTLRHLQKQLAQMKISRDQLVPRPQRHDPSIGSYCPRCLAQFHQAEGECPDCFSVQLVAFAPKDRVRS